MKTIIATLLTLGFLSGAASARSLFDDLRDAAPRSPFDQINATAPKSVFDQIRDTAPRSDGVFGDLQRNAP